MDDKSIKAEGMEFQNQYWILIHKKKILSCGETECDSQGELKPNDDWKK